MCAHTPTKKEQDRNPARLLMTGVEVGDIRMRAAKAAWAHMGAMLRYPSVAGGDKEK
jgi:hypothetical protein